MIDAYGYDARNHLVSVDGKEATYSYNAFGQRVAKHAQQAYILTADLNQDGVVDEQDIHVLQAMIKAKQSPPEADLNQDGVVDQHDIHCLANAIHGKTASKGKNASASACHVGDTITHETERHFVYQGSELLGEYDSHGNVTQEIVWMGNIPVAVMQDGQIDLISVNQLGAPVAITTAGGTVVWTWEPRAFGNVAPNEDPAGKGTKFVFNLRFPGQYYDAETGLNYNYFRYYDPSTGRYITSDLIGLAGGLNTYVYVGSNPVMYSDPLGLIWVTIGYKYHTASNVLLFLANRTATLGSHKAPTTMNCVGCTRTAIQEWFPNSAGPQNKNGMCHAGKGPKLGDKREINQAWVDYGDGWQPSGHSWHWEPPVPSPTYESINNIKNGK